MKSSGLFGIARLALLCAVLASAHSVDAVATGEPQLTGRREPQPASLSQPWALLQRSLSPARYGGEEDPLDGSQGAWLQAANQVLAGRGFALLDPTDELRATNITDMVNDQLLPAVLATHHEDQGEINASRAAVTAVEELAAASFQYVADVEAVVEGYRQEHQTCRAAKLRSCNSARAACVELDNFSLGGCPDPPNTRNRTALMEFAASMLEFWEERNRSLFLAEDRCNEASENCTSHTLSCAHLQRSFEQGFCTWREKLRTVCDWYTSAKQQALDEYHTRITAVKKAEEVRKQEYRALTTLLCYVDVWWRNQDPITTNCADTPVDLEPVTIKYPAVPDELSSNACSSLNETMRPCSASFVSKEYASIAGMMPEEISFCTSCPDAPASAPTAAPMLATTRVPTPAPSYTPGYPAVIQPTAAPQPSTTAPPPVLQTTKTTTQPADATPAPATTSTAPTADAGAFAGAAFWFAAEDLQASDGEEVPELPDRSGHDRTAPALPGGRAAFVIARVGGRPALYFPAKPPWRCYDTPPLPGGVHGQVTIAAVLQWESQEQWATVAEFQHDQQYAVKRHGGKELCGLQTKGLCTGYFMGSTSEQLNVPYVYTARYNGSAWQACLQSVGSITGETCSSALGPGSINASGPLRIGGSVPGLGHCNADAMSGWLSELVLWHRAKSDSEMLAIKTALLGERRPLVVTSTPSLTPPARVPEPTPEPAPEPAVPESSLHSTVTDDWGILHDPEIEAFEGAEFWFDAAEARTDEHGEVMRLTDRSGAVNDAFAVDGNAAKLMASAVHGRPALYFPAAPPRGCYDTRLLPGGSHGQVTIAAVLQWETQEEWATVAEFQHDQSYALKRHGGQELCGLQTKGLCSRYFMGRTGESLNTPYLYTAHYNGTMWEACLQDLRNDGVDETCVRALGPGALEAHGVLRLGGTEPGTSYCTEEAMSGWLSEFVVWPVAKTAEEMKVIKATLRAKGGYHGSAST